MSGASRLDRAATLDRVRDRRAPWDLAIIGGGATGLGTAVDAAARGYDVVLLEQSDFAKGTSSRSTKLVHGGVRYLQQGNVALVIEALRERGMLRRNAPHLVRDLAFIVPSYEWWESPFYGIGLKVYDMLAGRYGFGRSSHLSRARVVEAIPAIRQDGLRGGTRYFDGLFDDARLAIDLARTAHARGAAVVNHARVVALRKDGAGAVTGVVARDEETGAEIEVPARVVVNATGPFADGVRRLDRADAAPVIAASLGVHVVLDRSFLAGDAAIMVPHTRDGRVMFLVPWHDVVLAGTTDTPLDRVELEPRPRREDVELILDTANRYLARPAAPEDARSVFAGIRPLLRVDGSTSTAALSREHAILIDPDSGLVTVAGGKWTTYRRMAEDIVDQAAALAGLEPRPCPTRTLPIHGAAAGAPHDDDDERDDDPHAAYGTDAAGVEAIARDDPALAAPLHERLPIDGAMIAWACRAEMARTVEDALARRTRALVLDARAAMEAAPRAAAIMAGELGRDAAWQAREVESFSALAAGYLPDG